MIINAAYFAALAIVETAWLYAIAKATIAISGWMLFRYRVVAWTCGLFGNHLAEAERHLAQSDNHITRQIEIIDGLERGGHSTDLALDLLAIFRAAHANYIAHRDLIRKALQQ
jgi:hypothetical protein